MKKRKVGVWVFVAVLIVLFVLAVMNGKTVQEQQRECEKQCAPRSGAWIPDPRYPNTSGKANPTVCECR